MRVNVVETITSPVRTSFKGGRGGRTFPFLIPLVLELFLVCKEESMCRQL